MIGRRTVLRWGLGAGAALALPPGVAAQDARRRIKSVIWLWMGGGPSQVDTWDPKPGQPFKAIDTAVAGIRISELLPLCAAQAARLSILRTVSTLNVADDQLPTLMRTGIWPTCFDVDPAVGTILSFELGNADSPAPQFVAVDSPGVPECAIFGRAFLPFHVRGTEDGADARRLVDVLRHDRRAALLKGQEEEWSAARPQMEVDRLNAARTRAEALEAGKFADAFRLDLEPDPLRKAYGAGFGSRCLLARRLVQAGCAVVEVGMGGWDQAARTRTLASELDAGMGTLIADLAAKEMLQDTLVVWCGPHGRSPILKADGGRDPWTKAFSAVLAGGGLAGGRVHGDTGPEGRDSLQPVGFNHFFATLYAACGINPEKRFDHLGRKMIYAGRSGTTIDPGKPIKELF